MALDVNFCVHFKLDRNYRRASVAQVSRHEPDNPFYTVRSLNLFSAFAQFAEIRENNRIIYHSRV